MREFPFLLFLFLKGICLQSSEIHSQTDQKLIFNTPYLGFKKMENGSSALSAILKISVILSCLAEVLEYSCISLSCQTQPYWMMSYAVPRKRDCVLLLRETCPDRGVRDNLFTQFRIQIFVPEAICSVETDNSKTFLEKIELTDCEIGNRLVLKYSHLGWNPARLYMNHYLGLKS